METYPLITSLTALVGTLVTIHIFNTKGKNKRVDDFVKKFISQRELRENISALWLSGINNLKSDQEIKQALEQAKNLIGHHPLLEWKDEVERIGNKRFFNWISKNEHSLTNDTINKLLTEYKSHNTEKSVTYVPVIKCNPCTRIVPVNCPTTGCTQSPKLWALGDPGVEHTTNQNKKGNRT